MRDPRIERLGKLIAEYSLQLGEGDMVRIDGTELAAPHMLELMRAALARGANPYTNVMPEGIPEVLVARGTEKQIAFVSQIEWNEVETVDAVATLWSDANTRSFTRADPVRHGLYLATRRSVSRRLRERTTKERARWVGTLVPTHAFAQDAEMSLPEFEDFVYRARVLGEVAFGLNYEIDRFTRNILFDEKIGGTMHLALGSGFKEAGSENVSGIHWDMICDLRADGEVYADGELVWRAGRFLEEPAVAHVG